MELIRKIEESCDVEFTGTTEREASEFISEWIDEIGYDSNDDDNFYEGSHCNGGY